MTRINQDLFAKIQRKLNVGQARAYARITKTANATHLPPRLAAVALAAELGINTTKKAYATEEDRELLRRAIGTGADRRPADPPPSTQTPQTSQRASRRRERKPKSKSNKVMVVHGRNEAIREALYTLLRALGLKPLEYTQGIRATRKGAPVTREVLDALFEKAAAVVVLLTGDDEARLKPKFRKPNDQPYERQLTGQARANVLFEAGRASGSHPDQTIFVQVGRHRPFSDTAGVQIIHLGNDLASRKDLATRLDTAGCDVDMTGNDRMSAGNFRLR